MKSLIVLSLLFCSQTSFAYIPKTSTIIQRLAENNGNGAYQIEQEVVFQTQEGQVSLKETWIVDSDLKMKLIVQGTKELRDQIKWTFIYDGSRRYQVVGNSRLQKNLDDHFLEKYFHNRKSEEFARYLTRLGILDEKSFEKFAVRTTKEVDHRPDPLVRLSRIGGSVAYALGLPSPEEGSPRPGLWIEQDLFLIRKFRPSPAVELSADNYSTYTRGLNFPKLRSIKWDSHSVEIHTLAISAREKTPSVFNVNQMEASSRLDLLADGPTKSMIEDFYKRFR